VKQGQRVRVNKSITPGYGKPPAPGMSGRVEQQLEDGTVVVKLDDGRRVLLASWEVDEVKGEA
jgi:hypothetical protein